MLFVQQIKSKPFHKQEQLIRLQVLKVTELISYAMINLTPKFYLTNIE